MKHRRLPRIAFAWTVRLLFPVLAIAACDGGEAPIEAIGGEGRDGEAARYTPPTARFSTVTAERLDSARAAGRNWLVYGGAYNNQRYSTLDQITRENVHTLVPVWVYQTGIPASFETTPVVVDNTMYLTTPESHVVALNAATGEKLWEFVPELETTSVCCGPNNRGVAVFGDRVYVGTLDARLVALDAKTGAKVWEAGVADPEEGYSITMAPLAYGGKVFIGVAGGEYGIRGAVHAFDAESGDKAWTFHTIPAPGEADNGWWGEFMATTPFGTPLNRDVFEEQEEVGEHPRAWRTGGGGVYMTPAYDPRTGTLFFVVGNPSPDLAGSVRPGDNLYTGSIVALDGETGELRWHFQYLPHDRWNLSGGSPPFLFDRDGKTYVGHAGKTGWLYVVEARSGTPVLRSENFVPQENLFAPPSREGTYMAPGTHGGNGGSPVAYSPRTGLAYVPGIHQPMIFTRGFTPKQDGRPWLGGSMMRVPDGEEWGVFSAVDVATGEIAWQRKVPVPMLGSALATAGDVVFAGQGSGTLDAFDARTGELLWQFHTGAGVHGGPVTYMVDSVQYVAVAAGGNHLLDTPRGDDVYVFALRNARPAGAFQRYPEAEYRRASAQRYGSVRQVPAAQLPQPGDSADTARAQPDSVHAPAGPSPERAAPPDST